MLTYKCVRYSLLVVFFFHFIHVNFLAGFVAYLLTTVSEVKKQLKQNKNEAKRLITSSYTAIPLQTYQLCVTET